MYTVCVGVVSVVGYYSAALDPVFPTTCAVDLSAAVHGCLHKYMYIATFILALSDCVDWLDCSGGLPCTN